MINFSTPRNIFPQLTFNYNNVTTKISVSMAGFRAEDRSWDSQIRNRNISHSILFLYGHFHEGVLFIATFNQCSPSHIQLAMLVVRTDETSTDCLRMDSPMAWIAISSVVTVRAKTGFQASPSKDCKVSFALTWRDRTISVRFLQN